MLDKRPTFSQYIRANDTKVPFKTQNRIESEIEKIFFKNDDAPANAHQQKQPEKDVNPFSAFANFLSLSPIALEE